MARSKNFPRKYQGFEFRRLKTKYDGEPLKFNIYKGSKLALKKPFISVPEAKRWVQKKLKKQNATVID